MLSCTHSRCVSRLQLRTRSAGAVPTIGCERRYGPCTPGSFCSQAGLQQQTWLTRLRRALEREQFIVHYQPIVSLRDDAVSHYEALVRLADEPTGQLVSPARFLPAAERTGLIRQIDRLVLEQVLALVVTATNLRVAVNLSALSVTDRAMLQHIQRALARHGADAERLVFEITETDAISDMDRARAFCAGVRALGCEVALDDFGAGFGSFQYLKALPFDHLKIDGGFVRSLPCSPKDQLVVQALAGLAGAMGKHTVAEYVRDEATVALLRRYGVDYAQGFALGRPVPAAVLMQRAHARRLQPPPRHEPAPVRLSAAVGTARA